MNIIAIFVVRHYNCMCHLYHYSLVIVIDIIHVIKGNTNKIYMNNYKEFVLIIDITK